MKKSSFTLVIITNEFVLFRKVAFMLEAFIQFLSKSVSLTPVDISLLQDVLKVKSYKRGEFILQEGEISQAFYFNLKGFVRLFYLRNGEDKTAYFYPENNFISAYESFVKQEPARLNLQAMEKSQLVEVSIEASRKLLAHSPKFEAVARAAMESELINHQRMVEYLLAENPETRYDLLLEENPDIFQRVPQRYIASYIGIKPESLSRIKRRQARKP
jgi:CRP-like cAMP-binding protein